jgi:hypothetical protein
MKSLVIMLASFTVWFILMLIVFDGITNLMWR